MAEFLLVVEIQRKETCRHPLGADSSVGKSNTADNDCAGNFGRKSGGHLAWSLWGFSVGDAHPGCILRGELSLRLGDGEMLFQIEGTAFAKSQAGEGLELDHRV